LIPQNSFDCLLQKNSNSINNRLARRKVALNKWNDATKRMALQMKYKTDENEDGDPGLGKGVLEMVFNWIKNECINSSSVKLCSFPQRRGRFFYSLA